jgi:hypothetical protein
MNATELEELNAWTDDFERCYNEAEAGGRTEFMWDGQTWQVGDDGSSWRTRDDRTPEHVARDEAKDI